MLMWFQSSPFFLDFFLFIVTCMQFLSAKSNDIRIFSLFHLWHYFWPSFTPLQGCADLCFSELLGLRAFGVITAVIKSRIRRFL